MNPDISLYVHIPFCRRKCNYCSFISYPHREDSIPAYVSALKREMALRSTGQRVRTVYFGGGTPSLLSAEEAQELLEVRSILEGAIAGYAAENITRKDLHELRKLLGQMDNTLDNITEYFPLNREFHNRIIKAANKKRLAEMTLSLRNATEHYGRLGMAFPETRRNVFHPQHYQIVDALEHRDKDKVERLMREHMLVGARNIGIYFQNLKLP